MTTAATSLLGLALPVTGELQGTWGDTVNNQITSLLDTAVAGTTTLSTDADVTLTTTTLASNQARQAILLCSGARTALRTITAPAQSKIYTIINATTGGYSVKLVGVGPTTGVTVAAGRAVQVAWNGSDFIDVSDSFAANGTANGVVYLNASKVPTTGSVLTFDGNTLTAVNTSGNAIIASRGGKDLRFSGNYAGSNTHAVISTTTGMALAFMDESSEFMRLTSTGLGIGTSSPGQKLDVAGNITSTAWTGRANSSAPSADCAIYRAADNTLGFSTASTERMRLDSSGNLGLGVTPSTNTVGKMFEIGAVGNQILGFGASDVALVSGAYYNSGWKYSQTNSLGAGFFEAYNGTYIWYQKAPAAHNAGDAIGSWTQAMTLDASGRLGIGVTSPVSKLDLFPVFSGSTGTTLGDLAYADIYARSGGYNNQYGQICFGYSGSYAAAAIGFLPTVSTGSTKGDLVFGTRDVTTDTAPTERARIDSDGNFLVGKTSSTLSSNGFSVQPNGNAGGMFVASTANSTSSGDITYAIYTSALSQYQFYVGYNGTVYARSTSITGLSDQREKENIKPLDVGLNEVLALQPRRFDWKDGSLLNVAGFVAQEVQTVLPDLVEEYKINDEENRLGLKMGDMVPMLVKAIQEQQAIIETLTARITALEGQ